MDELIGQLPKELVEAVKVHGFHKVAAALYGVDEITEKTAMEIIGRNLMARRDTWQAINSGLASLASLR